MELRCMIKHIFDAAKWDIGIISQARLNNSGCTILPYRISVYYSTVTLIRSMDYFYQCASLNFTSSTV